MKKRGKPLAERKGVNKMQSTSAMTVDRHTKPSSELFWARRTQAYKNEKAAPDKLLHEGLSKFERDLIIECREIGMSDEEIQKWLQEI